MYSRHNATNLAEIPISLTDCLLDTNKRRNRNYQFISEDGSLLAVVSGKSRLRKDKNKEKHCKTFGIYFVYISGPYEFNKYNEFIH